MVSKLNMKNALIVIQIGVCIGFTLVGLYMAVKYSQHDFLKYRMVSISFSYILVGVLGIVSGVLFKLSKQHKIYLVIQIFSVVFCFVLMITSIRLVHNVKKINDYHPDLKQIENEYHCCGWREYHECDITVPRERTCYKAIGKSLKRLGYFGGLSLFILIFVETMLLSIYYDLLVKGNLKRDEFNPDILANDDSEYQPF